MPNGSLGHLISELILFAPVPAQLNLKEVHVQVALGGSCFKTLKSGPPRNPSYNKGDMITNVVRQMILVQFPVSR